VHSVSPIVGHRLDHMQFTKGKSVNKSQLIEALSGHFDGNKKQAGDALQHVLDTIAREVARGEKVAITGFGAFERVVRPSRMVRNPRTGERKRAKKTAVPRFKAGAELKAIVAGVKKPVKATATTTKTAAKRVGTTAAATKSTATKTTTRKTTATKAAPSAAKTTAKRSTAKTTAAKTSPATKTTATKTATKKAPATRTASKSTAKTTTAAKKAPATKSSASKTTAKRTAKKS
jgi:DNA-binding protein HU-beta